MKLDANIFQSKRKESDFKQNFKRAVSVDEMVR